MRRRMLRFGAIALAAAGYSWARAWFVRWGASDAEVAVTLPGDDLLAEPSLVTTRAITIDAPAEEWR